MTLYPLQLEPKVKEVVWGGRWLAEELGRAAPPDAPLGESWEAFGGSLIANGAFAGQTLGDVFAAQPTRWFGTLAARYPKFPLLVKFIDARENLSIQVHPDDAGAQALEAYPFGKTEFWYILEAQPDAQIVYGLREEICSAEELGAAMRAGAMEPFVAHVAVRAGDVVYIPAGTVHALTAGVVVYELQQDCDITYRLYDWGRTGREIHLDKGLQVIDFDQRALQPTHPQPVTNGSTLLAESPFFRSRLHLLEGAMEMPGTPTSFTLLTVTEGQGTLEPLDTPFETLSLSKGTTLLLPAGLGCRLTGRDLHIIASELV